MNRNETTRSRLETHAARFRNHLEALTWQPTSTWIGNGEAAFEWIDTANGLHALVSIEDDGHYGYTMMVDGEFRSGTDRDPSIGDFPDDLRGYLEQERDRTANPGGLSTAQGKDHEPDAAISGIRTTETAVNADYLPGDPAATVLAFQNTDGDELERRISLAGYPDAEGFVLCCFWLDEKVVKVPYVKRIVQKLEVYDETRGAELTSIRVFRQRMTDASQVGAIIAGIAHERRITDVDVIVGEVDPAAWGDLVSTVAGFGYGIGSMNLFFTRQVESSDDGSDGVFQNGWLKQIKIDMRMPELVRKRLRAPGT
jgi:hypothetical protein